MEARLRKAQLLEAFDGTPVRETLARESPPSTPATPKLRISLPRSSE
jgi:hypothetical protein